jgi:acyl dehydratase
MSLDHLVGSTYGPYVARVAAEKVAAYVSATGDDAERWAKHAPPSYAGALLFVAAPAFLQSEEVSGHTRVLVHADQRFVWHRALGVEEEVSVAGELTRARERGGLSFVTFEAEVLSGEETVIESTSTFLMASEAPAEVPPEHAEPPVSARGSFDVVADHPPLEPGPVNPLARSASRLDLVKYAAASGDFNPVHFDHETASAAGFPGVVAHGLLMGAWLMQTAAAYSSSVHPIAEARLRFRNPLLPGAAALIQGEVSDVGAGRARVDLTLAAGDVEIVGARVVVRTE